MPTLNYQQNLTGVQVPRSEILNARPWATMKLIGFIIASIVVVAALLMVGALLAGARVTFPLIPPGAPSQQAPPPPAPTDTPAAPAAAPPAPTQITIPSLPEIRVVTPPQSRQLQAAPALASDEALEQTFKGHLLVEGEDP